MLFEVRSTYVDSTNKQLEDRVTRYSGTVDALNRKIAQLMSAGHPDYAGSHMIAMQIRLVEDFEAIT